MTGVLMMRNLESPLHGAMVEFRFEFPGFVTVDHISPVTSKNGGCSLRVTPRRSNARRIDSILLGQAE